MSLLAINGSPSSSSRTHALAAAAAEIAGGTVLDVSGIEAGALLLRGSDATLDDALDRISGSEIIFLATPIYRATYSGLLKVLLDQLPADSLVDKACVLGATGGSSLHFLSLDTGLRAVVASLRGWTAPTVAYATPADFDGDLRPMPPLAEVLRRGIDEAQWVTRQR